MPNRPIASSKNSSSHGREEGKAILGMDCSTMVMTSSTANITSARSTILWNPSMSMRPMPRLSGSLSKRPSNAKSPRKAHLGSLPSLRLIRHCSHIGTRFRPQAQASMPQCLKERWQRRQHSISQATKKRCYALTNPRSLQSRKLDKS